MNTKFLLLTTCLVALSFPVIKIHNKVEASNKANGNLVVDFGVPKGTPLFDFDDFKPGDCTEKNVTVTNNSDKKKKVYIFSSNEIDEDSLASVLSIEVIKDSNVLYGVPKKYLSDFYNQNPQGVYLGNILPNTSLVYQIKICFDIDAGNIYQLTETIFDLSFAGKNISGGGGDGIDLPAECAKLEGKITKVIYGTDGDDTIIGSSANELIYSLNGNDKIFPGSGHDCVITGNGNNYVKDVSGNDVIVTGSGNDIIDAGSGNDIVYAGSGNDIVYAGSGNDIVYAGSGNDIVYGQDGDDTLYGGPGNDILIGGGGYDTVYGDSGTDTCQAESVNQCEL